jgi:hypothetical protein
MDGVSWSFGEWKRDVLKIVMIIKHSIEQAPAMVEGGNSGVKWDGCWYVGMLVLAVTGSYS